MTQTATQRSGFVSIIGRPNVGKSTLLNALVKKKVSIVTEVPQTTRSQIRGIYTDSRGQIVFVDTPGLHKSRDKLDQYMNNCSIGAMEDVDVVIYLVDASRRIGREEEQVAGHLAGCHGPIILGLNKVDLKTAKIEPYISFWEKVRGEPVQEMKNFSIVALSAKNEKNVDTLRDVIFDYLPEGPGLYPPDQVTDTPQKMVIADVIREKLILNLRQEIPHAIGVVIETLEPRKGKTVFIRALILVERDTQKEIVIGKHGAILKKVGTLARTELEGLLQTKVFLELKVKKNSRWRDDVAWLYDQGYSS